MGIKYTWIKISSQSNGCAVPAILAVFHLFPTLCPYPFFSTFHARKTPVRLNISYSVLLFNHYPVQKHIRNGTRKQKILCHTITCAEQPEEQSDGGILSKESFFDGWGDPFNSNDCVQFKPLNLAIACNYYSIYPCEHWAKNGLIFSVWINDTWCSPSHSRLVAGSCIYNTIDNIEQYWWQCEAG